MLKHAKQWYADTPRQKRYGWGFTISGLIGVAAFCTQLVWGAEFDRAFYYCFPLFFMISMVVLVFPQMAIDGIKGYWKHGTELDEMEKTIFQRASRIAFTTDYGYFCTVLLAIMFYHHDVLDIDHISLDLLERVLMGAVFVLIWTQGIATVVLYRKQDSAGALSDQTTSAKERPNA